MLMFVRADVSLYATYDYMHSFTIQALAIMIHQLCCSITRLHQNGFPNWLFDYRKNAYKPKGKLRDTHT